MTGAVEMIRRYGDPCLRRRAEAVDPAAPATLALREDLWTTLAADGGVGLAAPQIGQDQRVIVVRDPSRPRGQQRLDLVNPVITATFGPRVPFAEGCLSFPDLYIDIVRPQGVTVEHDTSGGRATLQDDGLVARIIQHEVDHLNGVLFIDHLTPARRVSLWPQLTWIGLVGLKNRVLPRKGARG